MMYIPRSLITALYGSCGTVVLWTSVSGDEALTTIRLKDGTYPTDKKPPVTVKVITVSWLVLSIIGE